MQPIDLTQAIALLLGDGSLRDAFANEPLRVVTELKICESDREAFLALRPAELEIQADILLRKRLARIRHMLPASCSTMQNLWSEFRRFARSTPSRNPIWDAHAFCDFLSLDNPSITKTREWNRLNFARSKKRLAIYAINNSLQILVSVRVKHWHEFNISFESMRLKNLQPLRLRNCVESQ